MECRCFKYSCGQIFKNLKVYWRHEMPTDQHKEKFKNFVRLLDYRANICMLMFTLNSILQVPWGVSRFQKSERFLNDDCKCNKELGLKVLPTLSIVYICFNVLRVALVFISYYKPNICKYYMIFQALMFVVREAAPINLGDTGDYNIMLESHLTFIMIGYPGWRDVIFTVAGYGLQTVVARYIFYHVEVHLLALVFKFIFTGALQVVSLALFGVLIGWVAIKYTEAEMARQS